MDDLSDMSTFPAMSRQGVEPISVQEFALNFCNQRSAFRSIRFGLFRDFAEAEVKKLDQRDGFLATQLDNPRS